MIIVVDSVKGNSGQGVPMYSRAGKSTINQYLVFSDKSEIRNYQTNDSYDVEDEFYDEDVERELKLIYEKEEELK